MNNRHFKLVVGLIFLVLIIGGLFVGYGIWKSNKIESSLLQFHSGDLNNRVIAVDGLLSLGERGREALRNALYPRKDAAKLLIMNWENVNKPNDEERTPLGIATSKGYIDIVELLIAKGADVDQKSRYKFAVNTPNSCYSGDIPYTPLEIAVSKGNMDLIELLLARGASINGDFVSEKALNVATLNGHKDIVKFLVDKGADVNGKNMLGKTPVHFAADLGRIDLVKLLVRLGAEIDPQDGTYTPLCIAVKKNNIKLANYLISKGANIKTVTTKGMTLLHYASSYGNINILKFLLAKDLDVNAKDKKGRTPLHSASRCDCRDSVKILLDNGAEVNALDKDGKTPLDVATAEYMKPILRKYGGKTSAELGIKPGKHE